ncbi:MAG: RES domain-containing protein [Rubrobacteraceae bacterium]
MGMEDRDLHLVRITAGRFLRLVDLRSNKTLSALGLDARVSTGENYVTCQKWARALHGAFPEIDGLRYAPRKAGEDFSNVVLFADRCADALVYSSRGCLEGLEEVVLAARDEYKLRPVFLIR